MTHDTPRSNIVVATDGLANVGVGDLASKGLEKGGVVWWW